MADIDETAPRAGDQPGDDDALDHQVRKMIEDEPVLDGSRLAFIRIADDVFLGSWSFADRVPFKASWKSRAAEAAKTARLELLDNVVKISRLDQLSKRAVRAGVLIRVRCECGSVRLGHTRESDSVQRLKYQSLRSRGRDVSKNVIVDGRSGRAVALSQAGDSVDGDILLFLRTEFSLEFRTKRGRAAQVARQIGTHPHAHLRRWFQMKVRIEIGDAVDLIERQVRRFRERLQLLRGQISVLGLNRPKAIENVGGYRHSVTFIIRFRRASESELQF